jgi:hypothetical protein
MVHSITLVLPSELNSRRATGFDQPPFRKLFITGFNFEWRAMNRLRFPSSLTSLTIDQQAWMWLDVGRILSICPQMQTSHLSSDLEMELHGPYMVRRMRRVLQDYQPLRSLILKNPAVPQSWMEDLLTTIPDLEDLQLIIIKRF